MFTSKVPAVLLFIFIAKFPYIYTLEISQTGTNCRKVMPSSTALGSRDAVMVSGKARVTDRRRSCK